jgi:putative hydrolase of the HAD superfamily
MNRIKVIGFDADDTLWVNEPLFQETEKKFCALLSNYDDSKSISQNLFQIEMQNLELYGYGAKAFMLSLIETAILVSKGKVTSSVIQDIIVLGKALLNAPVVLLEGVEDVLKKLSKQYKLIVATKGDLLDQERKLRNSALEKYFHHVEVMSDKTTREYSSLLKHLDVLPYEFVMIGNSLKSDILPVLELGCFGIHIPYATTWLHEHIDISIDHPNFRRMEHILDIFDLLTHAKSH